MEDSSGFETANPLHAAETAVHVRGQAGGGATAGDVEMVRHRRVRLASQSSMPSKSSRMAIAQGRHRSLLEQQEAINKLWFPARWAKRIFPGKTLANFDPEAEAEGSAESQARFTMNFRLMAFVVWHGGLTILAGMGSSRDRRGLVAVPLFSIFVWLAIAFARQKKYGPPVDPVFCGLWINKILSFEADVAALRSWTSRVDVLEANRTGRTLSQVLDDRNKESGSSTEQDDLRDLLASLLVGHVAPRTLLPWFIVHTMFVCGIILTFYTVIREDVVRFDDAVCDGDVSTRVCQSLGEYLVTTLAFYGASTFLAVSATVLETRRDYVERALMKILAIGQRDSRGSGAIVTNLRDLHSHLREQFPSMFEMSSRQAFPCCCRRRRLAPGTFKLTKPPPSPAPPAPSASASAAAASAANAVASFGSGVAADAVQGHLKAGGGLSNVSAPSSADLIKDLQGAVADIRLDPDTLLKLVKALLGLGPIGVGFISLLVTLAPLALHARHSLEHPRATVFTCLTAASWFSSLYLGFTILAGLARWYQLTRAIVMYVGEERVITSLLHRDDRSDVDVEGAPPRNPMLWVWTRGYLINECVEHRNQVASFVVSGLFIVVVAATLTQLMNIFVWKMSLTAREAIFAIVIAVAVACCFILYLLMLCSEVFLGQQSHVAPLNAHRLAAKSIVSSGLSKRSVPGVPSGAGAGAGAGGGDPQPLVDSSAPEIVELSRKYLAIVDDIIENIVKFDPYPRVLGLPVRPTFFRIFASYITLTVSAVVANSVDLFG